MALGLGQSGALYQLSGFLKGVQGYSALASGVVLLPFALATLIASLAIGAVLGQRFRATGYVDAGWVRSLIVGGLLLAAATVMTRLVLRPITLPSRQVEALAPGPTPE